MQIKEDSLQWSSKRKKLKDESTSVQLLQEVQGATPWTYKHRSNYLKFSWKIRVTNLIMQSLKEVNSVIKTFRER